MGITIGIDATNLRRGGGITHIVELLAVANPQAAQIDRVVIWADDRLSELIQDRPWLDKRIIANLDKPAIRHVSERLALSDACRRENCDILWVPGGGYIGGFSPVVTMSRNLLPFDRASRSAYGLTLKAARLHALRLSHSHSLRSSAGIIFLTDHAKQTITRIVKPSRAAVTVIPHGVSETFRARPRPQLPLEQYGPDTPLRLLYVSGIDHYKNQPNTLEAVSELRRQGLPLVLELVGPAYTPALEAMDIIANRLDPLRCWIHYNGEVPYSQLPATYQRADIAIFASSCENMPNTLLEMMASGLPIVCSDRRPMTDMLGPAGNYFDPTQPQQISRTLLNLIRSPQKRTESAEAAYAEAQKYTWQRCANDTFAFISTVAAHHRQAPSAWKSPEFRDTRNRMSPSSLSPPTTPRITRPYTICSNCVMDTTDTSIQFDQVGVCDHCRTYYRHTLPNWPLGARGQRQLNRITQQIKESGVGRQYDCIIGLSGGIDSSYLAYLARRTFGLRPLLFHVDCGWNSQESVSNIERLVDGLDCELFTSVVNWEEMRDVQLAFFKSGVPHIDAPQDHAIFATMYRYAAQHNIKYLLTGANLSTECIRNPVDWMYYQSDFRQLRDIHRRFGSRTLDTFPTTPILWHKVYLPIVKRHKTVRLLNYVRYVRREAVATLEDAIGWQTYPQKHFESRFTRFYEGYWLPKRFAIDVRRVQYSSLILTGQMSRTEALDALGQPPWNEADIDRDLEYIASKLEIDVSELISYLSIPRKSHRDYDSQRSLYSIGAMIMKLTGLEVGGKR